MLDHVTIPVSNIGRAETFYDQALRPLGITSLYGDREQFIGYGKGRKAFFWIALKSISIHIAFAVPDRALVDAFHHAGLSAGGVDNGKPGLRDHYHPNYYGAFILDPDGHNIEAVCHRRQ